MSCAAYGSQVAGLHFGSGACKMGMWKPFYRVQTRTQTAFKGHWEEIRSSLRRAREMHLMSYKLYTVPHDPDLFWFMLQASTESSQDSFVLKGLVTQEF